MKFEPSGAPVTNVDVGTGSFNISRGPITYNIRYTETDSGVEVVGVSVDTSRPTVIADKIANFRPDKLIGSKGANAEDLKNRLRMGVIQW